MMNGNEASVMSRDPVANTWEGKWSVPWFKIGDHVEWTNWKEKNPKTYSGVIVEIVGVGEIPKANHNAQGLCCRKHWGMNRHGLRSWSYVILGKNNELYWPPAAGLYATQEGK